jgi:tRNA-dihydrouridine synthase 2
VDSPHWDLLKPVVDALTVPVLVNGDLYTQDDIAKIRAVSGASSFLLARGAMANASVFREGGLLPYTDVVIAYLAVAAETDNVFQNTKYTLSRMLPGKCDDASASATVTVADLYAVKSNEQMFALWGQREVYDAWQDKFKQRAAELELVMPHAPQQHQQLAHAYDDSVVLKRQFFCDVCSVQMLSDQDVALHVNGKRHKNKLKRQAAEALSSHVARVEEAQTDSVDATGVDEPAPKRSKLAEESTASVPSPTDAVT